MRHISSPGGPLHKLAEVIPGFKGGDIPTNFFFVASGVIFALSRQPEESWAGTKNFWWERLARLYPLYLVCVLSCAPIGWVGSKGDWIVFITSGLLELTFMQGWFSFRYPYWMHVGWFMSSIAFCYLFYPLFAPMVRKMGEFRLNLTMFSCGLYALVVALYTDHRLGEQDAEIVRRIPLMPLPIFIGGVCLGNLIKRNLTHNSLITTGILGVGSAVLLIYYTPNGFEKFGAAPLFMLVVNCMALSRIPAPARFSQLGELGFTMYMIHWPLAFYTLSVLKNIGLTSAAQSLITGFVIVGTVILLSRPIHEKFERPTQKYLFSLLGLRKFGA